VSGISKAVSDNFNRVLNLSFRGIKVSPPIFKGKARAKRKGAKKRLLKCPRKVLNNSGFNFLHTLSVRTRGLKIPLCSFSQRIHDTFLGKLFFDHRETRELTPWGNLKRDTPH